MRLSTSMPPSSRSSGSTSRSSRSDSPSPIRAVHEYLHQPRGLHEHTERPTAQSSASADDTLDLFDIRQLLLSIQSQSSLSARTFNLFTAWWTPLRPKWKRPQEGDRPTSDDRYQSGPARRTFLLCTTPPPYDSILRGLLTLQLVWTRLSSPHTSPRRASALDLKFLRQFASVVFRHPHRRIPTLPEVLQLLHTGHPRLSCDSSLGQRRHVLACLLIWPRRPRL
ncbi:uncharacterized protein EI90DRAFT_781852 [Cantharellus anzutake]|uniref:uncharacterized protein n=1 Tax=Cantharellus anzutake TaxID=1750568 RepID=UPI00190563A7|nr:uncharacterized protein EI90DRAFT_781852 [Cantharellus anzutake]KAF8342748.1 hypothetical protein EI90DRAFT_781852 [Cantharellus anzutake]